MTVSDRSLVRILLLEDEAFIRETIRLMMRAFGNVDFREGADGAPADGTRQGGRSPLR